MKYPWCSDVSLHVCGLLVVASNNNQGGGPTIALYHLFDVTRRHVGCYWVPKLIAARRCTGAVLVLERHREPVAVPQQPHVLLQLRLAVSICRGQSFSFFQSAVPLSNMMRIMK